MAAYPFRRNAGFRRRAAVSATRTIGAATVVLLASCSGGSPVGNGIGPVSVGLTVTTGTEITGQNVVRVFQCFPGGLTATLYFSDGSSGNFTSRVKWSSSNPSAVRVSNGDIAVADGSGYYAAGTLLPVSPGNATLTANYSGLSAQIQVSVGAPTSLTLKQTVQSVSSPVTDVSLGVGTTRQFTVSAVTDGVSKDVTSFAKWSINPSEASVSASGLVTALGAGGVTPLTASFPECTSSTSANVTVANITGITIVPEFGSDPVLLNNTEKFNVVASLDNGATQDVSAQAVLKTTDSTVASFPLDLFSNNTMQPLTVGTVTVQATFNNAFSAPDVVASIAQSTLSSFVVNPSSAVLRAGSDGVVAFKAIGTYANGQTQDITRAVTWAVLNPALAGIGNNHANAGFAVPSTTLVGQTQVTATPPSTDSTAATTSATLTVDSTENPATPAP